jgi:hypothetical protein
MSRMNVDKIIQWKNEIDICNMLLRSQPDNDNIKAKLLLATDEYERHRNPKGYYKKNTSTVDKPTREQKVTTPKVRVAKEPKPYVIRFDALKRYKEGILVEHYKLVRSYVRNTSKHHKVYVSVL